ncbi:TetR/AcrR family transcriptional regulator [Clostridium beijerinckii]|uniref:AcrR family transcriptional regulator n=1 Tax=Clostridium beijerinckii TaxID=1520 RepID=A0AAX0B0F9_CLOBE|nr:TetR/AcrR family transcriptional regulator [Clostridium beijerinckii]NRT88681.1 AcrR family transcriptional regulator [Clostridium beijerinckii]NYC74136.1 AcrR family transcriptional regulator [Clostridium beijerinckii]
MEFQRARNEEQKSIRREQIIEATLKLYEREPLEKITLASIANELNFSRANLYKYVSTKEEIFLWILSSDLEKWVKKTYDKLKDYDQLELKTFCLLWSEQMYENQRFLKLFSILVSVLRSNVTTKSLEILKQDLANSFGKLNLITKKFIPNLTDDELKLFNEYQIYYASSLYSPAVSSKNQRQEFQTVSLLEVPPDFVSRFAGYLEVIILGLQAKNK